MAEEKSYSEICKDLLILLKTFQKTYRETGKDLQNSTTYDKEEEPKGHKSKGEKEEKINSQEMEEQVEQGNKAENLQDNTLEDKLDTHQIDGGINSMIGLTKKIRKKKKIANAARAKKRDRIWKLLNQWLKRRRSRGPMGKIMRSLKGEGGRRERGEEGSYKTRRKKRVERLNLMDWNSKENG